jgi:hypothetical protein
MTHTKDEALKLAIKKAHMLVQPVPDKEVTTMELAKAVSEQAVELCLILEKALAAQPAPVQEPVATDWERIAKVQNAKLMAMCNEPKAFEQLCEIMDKYEALRPTPPAAPVPITPAEVHGMAEAHGIYGDARHWYVVGITDTEKHHGITKGGAA